MFLWALLPVATLLFYRGFRKHDFRYSIVTSLVSVIFSYAFSSPGFVMLYFLVLGLTTLFFMIADRKKALFYCLYLLINLLSFLLFNFWWISQYLTFYSSISYKQVLTSFFQSGENLSSLVNLSNSTGWLENVLRLVNYPFFNSGPNWVKVYNSIPLAVLETTFILILLWTIYFYKKNRYVFFLGACFFITLFLMKGVGEPLGEVYQFIFTKWNFFQFFRNPYEKFGIILPLFIAPLVSFSLFKLYDAGDKLRRLNFTLLLK